MNPTDDTIARYDPVEALETIVDLTGLPPETVAQVLEGEFDYLGCLGIVGDEALDDDSRREIHALRQENADLIEPAHGEYDRGGATLFIQRNRGIAKDTITRILDANYRFMDERGFLDDGWEET